MTLRASPAMKLAHAENLAAGAVDRAREKERERAAEAAAMIRAAHIVAAPCRSEAEAVRLLRCMAREVHARLVGMEGQLEADCLFASIARKGAHVPNPAKERAKGEAERVFAPANDTENAGKTPVAHNRAGVVPSGYASASDGPCGKA